MLQKYEIIVKVPNNIEIFLKNNNQNNNVRRSGAHYYQYIENSVFSRWTVEVLTLVSLAVILTEYPL